MMFPGTLSTRLRERGCICVCCIAIGSGRLLRPDVFGLGPARVHVFVKAKPGESPLSQLALWAKSGESSSPADSRSPDALGAPTALEVDLCHSAGCNLS